MVSFEIKLAKIDKFTVIPYRFTNIEVCLPFGMVCGRIAAIRVMIYRSTILAMLCSRLGITQRYKAGQEENAVRSESRGKLGVHAAQNYKLGSNIITKVLSPAYFYVHSNIA